MWSEFVQSLVNGWWKTALVAVLYTKDVELRKYCTYILHISAKCFFFKRFDVLHKRKCEIFVVFDWVSVKKSNILSIGSGSFFYLLHKRC